MPGTVGWALLKVRCPGSSCLGPRASPSLETLPLYLNETNNQTSVLSKRLSGFLCFHPSA